MGLSLFNRQDGLSDSGPKIARYGLKLPQQESSLAPEGSYTNADLDPTPPHQRNWGALTYWTFWISAALDPAGWQTGSSLIPIGLDVKNSIVVVLVANCVIGLMIVVNGSMGSQLRIPFPVAARASFGFYFSYIAVCSRLILAWFWFGIETANGGSAVQQLLRSIIPSFNDIPNTLPLSAGITTKGMIAFLVYWIIQFPFFFIGPSKLRIFFALKCLLVPATSLGMMGYLVNKAGGAGPIYSAPAAAHGTDFSAAWLLGFASLCGNWTSLAANSPDFTRYSSSTKSQWQQFPAVPVTALFISICGILAASASTVVYGGDPLWNPFDILALWTNRPAVFFCSLGWIIGGIGSNISTNSISAANDLTTLFPKYINITRGQVVTALIGAWVMVPWKILANAMSFLNFMAGYSVIIGPMVGILTTDFWIVKRTKYHVPELYDPKGIYRYQHGVNWRAAVTLLIVIPPLIPGLIQSVNPTIRVGGIFWWYAPGMICGYFPAMLVYTLLNFIWPHYPTLIASVVLADDQTIPISCSGEQSQWAKRDDDMHRDPMSLEMSDLKE